MGEVRVRCATRVCTCVQQAMCTGPRAEPRTSGAAGGREARQPRRGGFWGFLHRGACGAEQRGARPGPRPTHAADARQGRLRTRAERPHAPRGTGDPRRPGHLTRGQLCGDTGSKESKVPKCPEAKRVCGPAARPASPSRASRTGEDRMPTSVDPRGPLHQPHLPGQGHHPRDEGHSRQVCCQPWGPCRKQGLGGSSGPEFLCAACMGTD